MTRQRWTAWIRIDGKWAAIGPARRDEAIAAAFLICPLIDHLRQGLTGGCE